MGQLLVFENNEFSSKNHQTGTDYSYVDGQADPGNPPIYSGFQK